MSRNRATNSDHRSDYLLETNFDEAECGSLTRARVPQPRPYRSNFSIDRYSDAAKDYDEGQMRWICVLYNWIIMQIAVLTSYHSVSVMCKHQTVHIWAFHSIESFIVKIHFYVVFRQNSTQMIHASFSFTPQSLLILCTLIPGRCCSDCGTRVPFATLMAVCIN